MVEGFQDDLDWKVVKTPKQVFDYAIDKTRGDTPMNGLLFQQISNPSFFTQLAMYFKNQFEDSTRKEKY